MPVDLVVLVVVVVVVVVPVTGLRFVAVRRFVPPRSLLLRLGCAERVVLVVWGAAVVRWARVDARGILVFGWLVGDWRGL